MEVQNELNVQPLNLALAFAEQVNNSLQAVKFKEIIITLASCTKHVQDAIDLLLVLVSLSHNHDATCA